MIISTLKKTTKKQGLILSLKNTFLEKPESECQTEPPSLLRIKTLHLFFYKQSIFDPRSEYCLSFSKKSHQKLFSNCFVDGLLTPIV